MGGHGHGHEPPYKVPDYTIYKVEEVEQLRKLQEKLAKHGLKDPWARNYAWRFIPKKQYYMSMCKMLFRGWKLGIPAFLITLGVERSLGITYDHHAEHSDHGEHGHH